MALFALWQEDRDAPSGDRHRRLLGEAHVVPTHVVARRYQHRGGTWQLAAFATATRFYSAAAQIWCGDAEACILHGLLWREEGGRARLLDAAAVAALLHAPGTTLPDDIAGEFAVLRLHADGSVDAFADQAGLHHLFHTTDAPAPVAIANRAGFLATLRDDWRSDTAGLIWLPAIGYRVGTPTAWRIARAVPQEHRLHVDPAGRMAVVPMGRPVVAFAGARGLGGDASAAGEELLAEGLVQARAAIHLATEGQDRVDLPITGGKDSRAVLALALSAGLGNRLHLFTRGYEGHPDVVAGRAIAAACGLPHRREPPLGSDLAPHWSVDTFLDRLAVQAFQTDGMMGGWDLITGTRTGTDTLVTGHMGEVLKAYSKRPMAEGPLDPVAMVRLQAPFDPLDLLRPPAREGLVATLAAQMEAAAADGAEKGDQPDIFYYRNRIPNWLGGIRGIKSFERQPVMPLGVPALMRLAFLLSPEERKMELAHYRIVAASAPELLAPAFALQSWDSRLRGQDPGLVIADAVMPGGEAPPVFGNWQYSLNHNPAIRRALADIVASTDLALWDAIDRVALLDRLSHRTFDYFDGISLLGLVAAMFHEAGYVRPDKLRSADVAVPPIRLRETVRGSSWCWNGSALLVAKEEDGGRPLAPAMRRRLADTPDPRPPIVLHGHFDEATGAATYESGALRVDAAGLVTLHGWLHAPEHPGARIAVEARVDGRVVGTAVADRPRPDLIAAGLDDGRHGFALGVDATLLTGDRLRLTAFDSDFSPIGGAMLLVQAGGQE